MSFRRTFAIVLAALAVSAMLATNSSAAVKTVRAEVFKGPAPGTTLSGNLGVTATLGEHPTIGKKATFAFLIGGTVFDLIAEEVECVECKITNKEVTEKAGAIAYGEGKLKFKKAIVRAPENCTIKGETGVAGEVITKPLVFHGDFMDTNEANQKAFVQFIPAAGAATTFAELSLSGTGCAPFEGAKNATGTVYGESINQTGAFSKTQGLVFSQAIQETAGGSLEVEGVPASLTATLNYSAGETEFTVKPEPVSAKTVRAEFYKGPSPGTTLTEDLKVTASLVEHPTIGAKATWTFTIGGFSFEYTAEEVECVECKIANKEVTEKAGAIAYGEGKLRFKKATVMQPAGCTIADETGVIGQITTKPLIFHGDFMDTIEANQHAFGQFSPAAGTTFLQYALSGGGCEAFAGKRNVTGSLFAESVNNTGVFASTQTLKFSSAVQATSAAALREGASTAQLTASVSYSSVGGSGFSIK